MRRTRAVVCVLVLAGCAAGGVDPETAKQEHLAAGNRYMVDKKYSVANIESKTATRQDARFGEARMKLADASLATRDTRNAQFG